MGPYQKSKIRQIRFAICPLTWTLILYVTYTAVAVPGSTPKQLPEAMHLANVSCYFIYSKISIP